MRVPAVPRSALLISAAVVAAAAGPPAASAAGWVSPPLLPASNAPESPLPAAIADDGSAAVVVQGALRRPDVVRTGSGDGRSWRGHRLPPGPGALPPAGLAVGPGGAVLVSRITADGTGVQLDVRTTSSAPWSHVVVPSSTTPGGAFAVAADPTGGWVLAYDRAAPPSDDQPYLPGSEVVAVHLAADGTPDAPEESLGSRSLPPSPGAGTGATPSLLTVDRTGRSVLVTGVPGNVSPAAAAPAALLVRPRGGTFGAAVPYGTGVSGGDLGLRGTSVGRIALLSAQEGEVPQVATGGAGALPGPLRDLGGRSYRGFRGVFAETDVAPVGAAGAVAAWTDEQGDDCGEPEDRYCGAGGALFTQTVAAGGRPGTVVRRARAHVAVPVVAPLSGGRALLAWEQAARRGVRAAWHARLVGPTGKVTSISAPAGPGSGAEVDVRHSVATAGRWALAAWTTGSRKPVRVAVRRF